MNRFFTLLLTLTITSFSVSAQTPPNKTKAIVKPVTPLVTVKTDTAEFVDTLIENKLVELALKNPAYSASNHQNRINELELKKTKNAWLNLLAVSYTVNDQTFNKPSTTAGGTTLVYPKYNFGVTVPLGIIFSQGTQIKTARESLAYSKDQQQELARTIKANVLSKYKEYKLYNSLLEMQSELINDVLANASQAETSFRDGTIGVEKYIAAQKSKNDELGRKLNLKLQQDLIKIEIERLIGVPLEEVLHPAPPVLPAK